MKEALAVRVRHILAALVLGMLVAAPCRSEVLFEDNCDGPALDDMKWQKSIGAAFPAGITNLFKVSPSCTFVLIRGYLFPLRASALC
ncbi:hypothetical protein ACFLQR_00580 [Verrucomicrobiota bacterium]